MKFKSKQKKSLDINVHYLKTFAFVLSFLWLCICSIDAQNKTEASSKLPPLSEVKSDENPILLEDYIRSLSPIVTEKREGKTDEFCNKLTLNFENGIKFTSTDFGPCESCGHLREEAFFPIATPEEVLALAISLEAQYDSFESVLFLPSKDGGAWLILHEYGQAIEIELIKTGKGIRLIKDVFL